MSKVETDCSARRLATSEVVGRTKQGWSPAGEQSLVRWVRGFCATAGLPGPVHVGHAGEVSYADPLRARRPPDHAGAVGTRQAMSLMSQQVRAFGERELDIVGLTSSSAACSRCPAAGKLLFRVSDGSERRAKRHPRQHAACGCYDRVSRRCVLVGRARHGKRALRTELHLSLGAALSYPRLQHRVWCCMRGVSLVGARNKVQGRGGSGDGFHDFLSVRSGQRRFTGDD